MSQQWPPQSPDQGQPGNPYGNPNPYGQYGPPSQHGQPGQPGQAGPPSQGFPPPGGGYPSYPTYPPYPGQQPGQPGTWGPPSQFGAGQYPPGYPQMGYGTPPPPKKSAGWIVPVIIGVILVVALGGAGTVFAWSHGGTPKVSGTPTATTAPTATATPAAPAGFKLYTDSTASYSLFVPDSWDSNGSSALALFTSASTGDVFEIEYLGVPLSGQGDAVANSFFSSVGNASNRAGPTSVSLSGATWSKYTGDVALAGTTDHAVLLITGHSDSTAVIAYLAPTDSFSSEDSHYFQTMLQSFTFLK